ncbi:uncharacterized protein LOC121857102 [Homarus americanus]|uniref:uncharacterized protein LOC121857102 n=1 Tax=Homarus americanus TaxID=6706 RepID=UPI001C47EFA9|nr:uncharacterized protein LOC121857102 [Homarus americanus]
MKNLILSIILSLAVVCSLGMVTDDSCTVDCMGKNALDKVADPYNCSNYYICLGDDMATDHPVPCPVANIFDTGKCMTGDPSTCEPTCKPPECPITCNGSLSMISDPFDCTQYYICIPGGVQGPIPCPSDREFFDGANCVKSKEVCCEVPCIPYCHPGDIQIVDPTDCHMYYICTAEGPVDPNLHFTCPSGDVFDYQVGRCVKGDKCTTLCPASTTPANNPTKSLTTTPANNPTNSATTKPVNPTATSKAGSTITAPVTPTTDCAVSLTCDTIGYFPRCHSCQPDFFECKVIGAQATINKCSGNLVFNTDPKYPFCVLPGNCPYHPPL